MQGSTGAATAAGRERGGGTAVDAELQGTHRLSLSCSFFPAAAAIASSTVLPLSHIFIQPPPVQPLPSLRLLGSCQPGPFWGGSSNAPFQRSRLQAGAGENSKGGGSGGRKKNREEEEESADLPPHKASQ